MTILLLLISLLVAAAAAEPPTPSPTTAPSNSNDFIRTSCGTTLYPDLCYHSLSGYATRVQEDPARLAIVAVGVSLSRARRMALFVANLTHQGDYGPDPRAASALHDCYSLFRDAVDEISGSMKQMKEMSPFAGEELRFQMSNVQTWMSAALTNEDTCVDGFQDVAEGPVKEEVCGRTVRVKQVTSNALALVNSFVAKVVNVP